MSKNSTISSRFLAHGFCMSMIAGALLTVGCRSKGDADKQAKAKVLSTAHLDQSETPKAPTRSQATARLSPDEKPKVANVEKWNYPLVTWSQAEPALSRMKSTGRPGLVVVKGEWCPHCRKYAELFSDPVVAEMTKSFELILLENESDAAKLWQGTGSYVPRTLFLDPEGRLDSTFEGPNPRYPHFFSSKDKKVFVEAMSQASKKYGS